VRALDQGAGVPGLPDWRCIPVPGHTPGHVAFFRSADRVLITGDAVLTVNLNSLGDLLARRHRVSGPPYISTWNWQAATESIAALATLRPTILAPGHGRPMTGPATAEHLACVADRLSRQPASKGTATDRAAGTAKIPSLRHPRGGRVPWAATAAERTMPLPGDELARLHKRAAELGLAALVEVHDESDLDRALAIQPKIVGINNRDLRTFEVDLATTFRLRPMIPPAIIVVSESGIRSRADALKLQEAGVDAMLVGERLMRRPDPGRAAAELLGA